MKIINRRLKFSRVIKRVEVHAAAAGRAGIELVDQYDLVWCFPISHAVLRHIREILPQTLVILMTAHATVETAVEAIRLGTEDYLLKPFELPGQQTDGGEFNYEDSLSAALDLYEKSHIERTLNKAGGDKIRAAELMGLSLSTLHRKLEKLGIES